MVRGWVVETGEGNSIFPKLVLGTNSARTVYSLPTELLEGEVLVEAGEDFSGRLVYVRLGDRAAVIRVPISAPEVLPVMHEDDWSDGPINGGFTIPFGDVGGSS